LVSIIYLAIPRFLGRLAVILAMIGLYLGIIYGYPVPECGRAILTPACNAAGYIDRSVFGPNFMIKPTDPEGLLSTLTGNNMNISDLIIMLHYIFVLDRIQINVNFYSEKNE
jgi:hypothetical protein